MADRRYGRNTELYTLEVLLPSMLGMYMFDTKGSICASRNTSRGSKTVPARHSTSKLECSKAEVFETNMHGCATGLPKTTTNKSSCVGFHRKYISYRVLSFDEALFTTECEGLDTSISARAPFIAEFHVSMDGSQLPKRLWPGQLTDDQGEGRGTLAEQGALK